MAKEASRNYDPVTYGPVAESVNRLDEEKTFLEKLHLIKIIPPSNK